MDVRLRPLRDDELQEFVVASRAEYVDGLVTHARLPEAFARDNPEHDLAEYATATTIPPGHALFWIEADGARVGRLWFAERESRGVGRIAWLFELEIDRDYRGQGLGRRALDLFEDEVRKRGLGEAALNVWGGNAPARALYRSQGYFERGVEMAKEIR